MSFHKPEPSSSPASLRPYLGVFRYTGRALSLVWSTHRGLSIALGVLTVMAGMLPAGVAYLGKLIVDSVVLAIETGAKADRSAALGYVGLECGVVASLAAIQRGLSVCEALLRAQLGQRVNVMILEKALTLDLPHFEDSEYYDKMNRARREASSRPLGLVRKTFSLIQNAISLLSYGGLLVAFSPWAVLVLAVAGLPAFFVETRFSGEAFRIFRWRTPETRQRNYLEWAIAREDFAKETQLFQTGPRFLRRYHAIFDRLYAEDRSLTLRRGFWGFVLGTLSTAAFYATYGWIVVATAARRITLGEMTMYLLVFKQGQSAFSSILSSIGGMYEDNLYLSNLYEFLDEPSPVRRGGAVEGTRPGDGVRFEDVWFTYPDAERPAVREVSFHLEPGSKLALVGENGSGKTTLIKLMAGLYVPTRGRITLDGLDIQDWDVEALRRRIGVIFQDFVRYQFPVGENIGVGDVRYIDDEQRWDAAAEKGMAKAFIDTLAEGYHTQLGRWFRGGRELSQGQWQKIALSRAFMREDADILVLDEPTAAMDAKAEAQIFERLTQLTKDQMAILISHRFSTVRMADHIAVLNEGRVVERGTHEALMAQDGQYAHLFSLQAAGYR